MRKEAAARNREGRNPVRSSIFTPFPAPGRPRKTPARGPHDNLPVQPTPLIGREAEVAAMREQLLRSEVRLLTLTGAGGSGKTRLAVEVAAGLVERFADGVFLVDLSPIRDASLVISAIARPVGVGEAGRRPLFDTLRRYLRERELLLILDNFEHVLVAAVQISELLATCPDIKVLATSRAPLRVRWEREFSLQPLPVRDLRQQSRQEDLGQNPAVGLFVQRAQAVRPTFCLTAETAQPVAEICLRLDGLPLALELAAARLKALAPCDLLERMQHRFEMLVGGPQDQLARHQTLRAAIDWSYGLLNESERAVFRRLAVFAGGWTIEAAEAVCGGDGPGSVWVVDALASLVDQSLVVAEESPAGELRYRFLETIREYAMERLERHGEVGEVRGRHGAYFLVTAELASSGFHGPDQLVSLDRLEREHDNMRAALDWFLGADGSTDIGLRLAVALWEFWWIRGYLGEGQIRLQKALDRGPEAGQRLRAQALNGLAAFMWMRGQYVRSAQLLWQSVALSKAAGDMASAGRGLCQLSLAEHDRNAAMALLDEALDLARQAGDRWGESYVRFHRGGWLTLNGDYEEAVPWLEGSASLARKLQDRRTLAYTLMCLGQVMQSRGARARAEDLVREAVGLLAPLRDAWGLVLCLTHLANVACGRGDWTRAACLLGIVDGLRARTGSELMPPDQHQHDLDVAATRKALGEKAFEAVWASGRALSLDQAAEYALYAQDPLGTGRPAGQPPAAKASAQLSAREREVATLVARGLTNRAIAEHLVVSERTVDAHLEHIRSKLGLRSRTQIATWAVVHGRAPAQAE